jgi:uncharacterized membrane protein YfcA
MGNEIITVLIGLFVGMISGITGVGGTSVLLTLVYYSNLIGNYTTIKGTMLYTLLFPVSILSVYNYYKSGNINIYVGNILVVSMLIGGFVGSKIILLAKESGDIISKRLGGIILIICGILILMKK